MESIISYQEGYDEANDIHVEKFVEQQHDKRQQLFILNRESDDLTSSSTGNNVRENNHVLCHVCTEFQRKYKCPRCGIFTCSVECVKRHKKETGCNGVRDKTQFFSSKEFSDNHLRSDFHFLEDVLQSKDTAHRTFMKDAGGNRGTKMQRPFRKKKGLHLDQFSSTYQNLENYSKGVKNFFHAVRKITKDRGIKLLLLPNGMTKRISNTSHIDPKSKSIMWRINLAFVINDSFSTSELCSFDSFVPNASHLPLFQSEKIDHSLNPNGAQLEYHGFSLKSSIVGVCLNNVNENKTIQNVIDQMIGNLQPGTPVKHLLKCLMPVKESLRCFMRIIPSPANDPLFCEIMTSLELKSALSGQSIIEYPTFYVCLEPCIAKLRLLIAPMAVALHPEHPRNAPQSKRKMKHDEIPSHIVKKSRGEVKPKPEEQMDEVVTTYANFTDDEDEDGDYDDIEDEEDDDYDEFMQEFLDLQNADIEQLKSLITTEEESLKKNCSGGVPL